MLESLIALIVFAVVILVCSRTLLEIQRDMKMLKEDQRIQNALSNTMLYLQRQLRYSFIAKIDSNRIEYFEINRDVFFSSHFNPFLSRCDSNRIERIKDTKFIALFSPFFQIASVIKEEGREMLLDRKAECGAMIPLQAKRKIFLSENVLYLDSSPLLYGVRRFDFKQKAQSFEIELCLNSCLIYEIPQSEIFYAF